MVKLREGEGVKRPCCLHISVSQNQWRPEHRVSITTPFQWGNSSQEHPCWLCLTVCLCGNCYTWTCVPWVCRLCTLDKIFFWWPARVTPILANSLQGKTEKNADKYRIYYDTQKKQKSTLSLKCQAAAEVSCPRHLCKSPSLISNDTQVECKTSFTDNVDLLSVSFNWDESPAVCT